MQHDTEQRRVFRQLRSQLIISACRLIVRGEMARQTASDMRGRIRAPRVRRSYEL